MLFNMLIAAGGLAIVLAGFGFSWARDPAIRERAMQPGWHLGPPTDELQEEIDAGDFDPSRLRVYIEAVALVKLRVWLLGAGAILLVVGAVGIASAAG